MDFGSYSYDPAQMAQVAKAAAEAYSSSSNDSESNTDDDNNRAAFRKPNTEPSADDEFQPRKRRKMGRSGRDKMRNKESAALGVFGSDSDEESGRRWKQKPLRAKGVSFVPGVGGEGRKTEDDKEGADYTADSVRDWTTKDEEDLEKKENDGYDDDDSIDDYGDDNDDDMGVGLGFTSAASLKREGHAFVTATTPSTSTIAATSHPEAIRFASSSEHSINPSQPLGYGFVPSSAYEPVLSQEAKRATTIKPAIVPRPSAFSPAGAAGTRKVNQESFGARMMAKMGYVQGSGLGKEGQGRNIIIEANLRPQGAGLGAVKEKSERERREEKRQARLRGDMVVDSSEEERTQKRAARNKRAESAVSGSGGGTRRPPTKTKYMTVEEVKKAAPGLHIPETFAPILDMTGPEKKLLTSSSGLMGAGQASRQGGAKGEEKSSLAADWPPEKVSPTLKLVRRARTDFMAIFEEWQGLQQRKAYTEMQAKHVRQELAELEKQRADQAAMVDTFTRLSTDNTDRDATDDWHTRWDRAVLKLKMAATVHENADLNEHLAVMSVAAVYPLLEQMLADWEPLKDSRRDLAEDLALLGRVFKWEGSGAGNTSDGNDNKLHSLHERDGLHSLHGRHTSSRTASAYETMMYRLWLPHVSRALRSWDAVHDTESLLDLCDAWTPVLPEFIRRQLLDQDVVRRLEDAVAKWEPRRAKRQIQRQSRGQNLPHLWLFPWLPYLTERHVDPCSADGLVAEVKRKFRHLIDGWEFYRGVVPGLEQWREVLGGAARGGGLLSHADNDGGGGGGLRYSPSPNQWRPLVLSHVLPGMARYLRAQFRVDPYEQAPYLELLTGEFQWLGPDLVTAELLAEIMVAEVFPMWHRTLFRLLTTPGLLTLDEVAQWIQWWVQDVFPAAVARQPAVAAQFEHGLALVNEALDLGGDPAIVRGVWGSGSEAERRKREAGHRISRRDNVRNEREHRGHSERHYGDGRDHRHRRANTTSTTATTTATAATSEATTTSAAAEEPSMRHFVEDWCENNDLQFIPERKKVHAQGPLYRITARGDGKGGVLAYFKGLRLYAETKKAALEIRADRDEDWVKLLELAS